MITGAHLSKNRKYRYVLWRIWDESKPCVTFICLNPSTANEVDNDPTVRRCINFARDWNFGGVYMANLFAFRSKSPEILKKEIEPIGKDNDKWLKELSDKSKIVIAAWGNHGGFLGRSNEILNLLPNVYYLKLNKTGQPKHPLYLKNSLKPKKFTR